MSFEDFSGRELPGDEVEIIGRAIPKKAKKVPINETRSYQPRASEEQSPCATHIIGDHRSLAFWEALESDLDEEELHDIVINDENEFR
jgi:hypothetical protein